MPKYRRNPIVIEAFQMTEERRKDNSKWPRWMNAAWNKNNKSVGALYPSKFPNSDGEDKLAIRTLEGEQLVDWGNYIIQGVKGELYPIKEDVFLETYEKVEN